MAEGLAIIGVIGFILVYLFGGGKRPTQDKSKGDNPIVRYSLRKEDKTPVGKES